MKSLFSSILDTEDDLDLTLEPVEVPPVAETPVEPPATPTRDELINVMNESVKKQLEAEKIFDRLELFTDPLPTTYTMEGFASHLQFHEETIMCRLEPDANVVEFRSNYGRKTYAWYYATPKVKTPRVKAKQGKERKKQGDGSEFNSQMTFIVRQEIIQPALRWSQDIPPDPPIYKFKVFRTGRIQIPGVTPGDICKVIDKTRCVTAILAAAVGVESELVSMNAVMKNYKFQLVLERGQLINLPRLVELLSGAPRAHMFVHSREYNKLSLKYKTPIASKPEKLTRIHIFLSGKIDVLGSFDCEQTREICTHLHETIRAAKSSVIVRPDYTPRQIPDNVFADHAQVLADVAAAEYASYNVPLAACEFLFK
jgi:hypothetical protein